MHVQTVRPPDTIEQRVRLGTVLSDLRYHRSSNGLADRDLPADCVRRLCGAAIGSPVSLIVSFMAKALFAEPFREVEYLESPKFGRQRVVKAQSCPAKNNQQKSIKWRCRALFSSNIRKFIKQRLMRPS